MGGGAFIVAQRGTVYVTPGPDLPMAKRYARIARNRSKSKPDRQGMRSIILGVPFRSGALSSTAHSTLFCSRSLGLALRKALAPPVGLVLVGILCTVRVRSAPVPRRCTAAQTCDGPREGVEFACASAGRS